MVRRDITMRIFPTMCMLFLSLCFQVTASPKEQRERLVSIDVNNTTIKDILHQIGHQAGVSFFYNTNHINEKERVSLNVRDIRFEDLMKEIFPKRGISWSYNDDVVTLQTSLSEQGKKRVSFTADNITLKDIFKIIQKQTGLEFYYNVAVVNVNDKMSLTIKDRPLDEVLGKILTVRGLGWQYFDKIIRVKPLNSMTTTDSSISAVQVSGKVTDASGTPIPGATIIVKGTKDGTTTDENGDFSLPNVPLNKVLLIRSVGYQEMEVSVKKSILAQLILDISRLDETVIVAYGTTTKRLNTGNVSSIKAGDIAKSPVSNPLASLQGRVPGMTIIQNTGVPGSSFSVLIRGRSSINSLVNNDPLYVIDGVPYPAQLIQNLNNVGRGGHPLNFINPSDILSIDILKDADATAIYGSRGANGVVLITTKKGVPGKPQIDINVYKGFGRVSKYLDWLNTKQYLEMRHEAFKNDDAIPDEFNAPDLLVWDTTRYTDWQKKLLGGTAQYTDIQSSISGGSNSIQYLVGGGYHRETTVFPGDGADEKASVHFNINSRSQNDRLRISLTGNYISQENTLSSTDFTYLVRQLAPNAPPIYNPDGSLNWANSTWANPLAVLESKYIGKTENLVSSATIGYFLTKDLEIKTNMGYTMMQTNGIITSPTTVNDPAWGITSGSASFNNSNAKAYLIEPQIHYNVRIGPGRLNALVGSTIQQNENEGQILFAEGFVSDALIKNIQAASTVTTSSTVNLQYKYRSVFSRLNFNIKDRYIVNLTGRRDGSSRFGPDKRFANFGAAGIAWILSNENFVRKHFPILSYGKLRASYGVTGNDQIPDYGYLDLYGVPRRTLPYQGTQGLYPMNLFNPDYAWELNKKLEGGLEAGLFSDRIYFSLSYYRNRSSNQLVAFALPSITGFTTIPYFNSPATVQNSGIEIVLNTMNIKKSGFVWNSSINLTVPRSKLVNYPDIQSSPYSSTYVIGEPLTIVKAYHFLGVDPETGKYQFADSKGNPTFTPDEIQDRTVIINTGPKFYGGISNSLMYKRIELSFLIQVVKQTGQNFLVNYMPGYYFSGGYNQPTDVLDRWKKPGDVTRFQKFSQSDFAIGDSYQNYAAFSDLAYDDASFIRLKNLSLSYNLPESWLKRLRLTNARFYFQCQNLFTITKYKGYDPEIQSMNTLPQLRVMSFGARIAF